MDVLLILCIFIVIMTFWVKFYSFSRKPRWLYQFTCNMCETFEASVFNFTKKDWSLLCQILSSHEHFLCCIFCFYVLYARKIIIFITGFAGILLLCFIKHIHCVKYLYKFILLVRTFSTYPVTVIHNIFLDHQYRD